MRLPGISRLMAPCASLAPKEEGRTVTSSCATGAPLPSSTATVVRPGATPNRKRLVGEAGRTSSTRGSAAKTLAAARPNCTTRPLPASNAMGAPERSAMLPRSVRWRSGIAWPCGTASGWPLGVKPLGGTPATRGNSPGADCA
jgi:hypothetical protein